MLNVSGGLSIRLGTFGERTHDKITLEIKFLHFLDQTNVCSTYSLSFLCLSSVESCSERGVRVCAV